MDTEHQRTTWPRRLLYVLAGVLLFNLGSGVMLWQVERFALKPYRIPSSAMEPTLHCPRPAPGCDADTADRIFVSRFVPGWSPSRGDIVVFRAPERALSMCGAVGTFTKRVVGLPGEMVAERKGTISIDGKPLEEPYVEYPFSGPAQNWRVPDGMYFVLGDNRAESCDSRVFGSVPRGNLIGPVVATYWPLDRMSLQ